jgi:hypothetical protein
MHNLTDYRISGDERKLARRPIVPSQDAQFGAWRDERVRRLDDDLVTRRLGEIEPAEAYLVGGFKHDGGGGCHISLL